MAKGDLQPLPRESGGEDGDGQHRGEQRDQGAPRAVRGRRRIFCGYFQERPIFDRQKVAHCHS